MGLDEFQLRIICDQVYKILRENFWLKDKTSEDGFSFCASVVHNIVYWFIVNYVPEAEADKYIDLICSNVKLIIKDQKEINS